MGQHFRSARLCVSLGTVIYQLQLCLYGRGPQPLGFGLVPVRCLLGTGLHGSRWAVGERAKLHLPLPIPSHRSHYLLNHRLHYHLNHPHPQPQSVEKLSSAEPVPGAKNVGDRCFMVFSSRKAKAFQIEITNSRDGREANTKRGRGQ